MPHRPACNNDGLLPREALFPREALLDLAAALDRGAAENAWTGGARDALFGRCAVATRVELASSAPVLGSALGR